MLSLFKASYTPSPEAVLLNRMYDVKEWLKPINPSLHNISNPHMFVIEKNVEGAVVLRYKNWSRDTEWKPSNDPNKGIVLLTKVCPFQIIKFLIDMPPPPPWCLQSFSRGREFCSSWAFVLAGKFLLVLCRSWLYQKH